jgi:hypothetical protein
MRRMLCSGFFLRENSGFRLRYSAIDPGPSQAIRAGRSRPAYQAFGGALLSPAGKYVTIGS